MGSSFSILRRLTIGLFHLNQLGRIAFLVLPIIAATGCEVTGTSDLKRGSSSSAKTPTSFLVSLQSSSLSAGDCVPVEITTTDSSGMPVSVPKDLRIDLSLAGSAVFYSDQFCALGLSSLTIPSGSSTATIYLSATVAQAVVGFVISSPDLNSQLGTFSVNPGSATQLAYTTSPSHSTTGSPFGSTITLLDSYGNKASNSVSPVTLAIENNSGGGTLSGTTTVFALDGVATFEGLSINHAGSNYTLVATSPGLTSASSRAFNISAAPASKLVFNSQPSGTTAGGSLSMSVSVKDAFDNTVTGYSGSASISIQNNAGSGILSGTTTVAIVNGIANFSGLSIDKVGAGYTLRVDSSGLTSATSTSFDITPGSASTLAFTTEPTHAIAGGSLAPSITIQDAFGNRVTSSTASVSLAIGSNPGGGSLSGTTTVSAVNGIAVFSGLSINKMGMGYTLAASSSGLTGTTSSSFNISAASASKLVFTSSPSSSAAGSDLAMTVAVRDPYDNLVATSSSAITISIGSNPGGSSLSGTTTVNASGGIAAFSGLALSNVGTGYTLIANAAGLTAGTSSTFNITPSLSTRLAFSLSPTNTSAGVSMTAQVEVQDSNGNLKTDSSASITLVIGTNPGSGTLSGTLTRSAVNGVANFTGLTIDKAGVGYTITASATDATNATSGSFTISPATASKLAMSSQPNSATAGASFSTTVIVQDAFGNTVTSSSDPITLAIGTNPGSGTLSGTLTSNASSGIAIFSNLSINKAGSGYTLVASSGSLASATSTSFNISPASATTLAFSVQPSSTVAGTTISPDISVMVKDNFGNTVTSSTASITLAIGTNAGGGTLSGTTTITATSGVATFSGVNIDKSGSGYTLVVNSPGLSGETSSSFSITPASATKLAITTQPTDTTAGASISPSVVVTVQDSQGNTVTGSSDSITLAIGTNPGGGTLSGTATVSAINGIATFSGLSINRSGTGYTLTASGGGLTGATSNSFNIAVAAAAQLAFTAQPSNTTAGASISPDLTVTIQDAFGNTVSNSSAPVTLSMSTNPGSGTLSGTAIVSAVSGVATFTGLTINRSGSGYKFTASSGSLASATSHAFNISAGSAAKLAITTQPSNAVAGSAISGGVIVSVQDSLGNTITSSSASISLSIDTNPGSGTLSGTTTVLASGGSATFSGLSINKAGNGYTLQATSSGLTAATTNSFNISAGSASKLVFSTSPSSTTAGTSFAPVVTVQDANGNPVTTSSASIDLAIGTNPASGTLSGTTSMVATSGIASFTGLSINKAGSGYTLLATSSGLTSATSDSFNISAGPASKLVFTTSPSTTDAGSPFAPVVTVQDSSGNTVTSSNASISVEIDSNPGSGVLSGTTTLSATSGAATFSGLSINLGGTAYTLKATSSGLTDGTSSSFNINAVCNAGTAAVEDVLSGKTFGDGTASSQSGTMLNHGSLNISSSSLSAPGYVSSITGLTKASICSTTSLFGETGTAKCITTTTSSAASAATIAAGKECWDANGTKLTGTGSCGLSIPTVSSSGNLTFGTSTTAKTLTFTLSGSGTTYVKLSFSGSNPEAFRITSYDGKTVSQLASAGPIIFGLTSGGTTSKTVSIETFYVDGTAKSMTATATYGNGTSETISASATISDTPLGISNLKLYLSADSISGLSDGSAVATWTDKSGNGNDVTQSNATYKPTFKTNVLNTSYPVVRFNGTNYLSNNTLIPASGTAARTVIAVVKPSSYPASFNHAIHWGSSNWEQSYGLLISSSAQPGNHYWADAYWTGTTIGTSSPSIIVIQYDGTKDYGFVNGSAGATASATKALNTGTAYGVHIGSRIAAPAEGWYGDIAEVIIYSKLISTTEREAIECYFKTKYGLTLGHGC